jgi:hypothetical protein
MVRMDSGGGAPAALLAALLRPLSAKRLPAGG